MVDRKERKAGDPFGGAPMKRFDGASQLPAPPSIEGLVEEVKQDTDRDETPAEFKGLRCPCGKLYGDCQGMDQIGLSKDQIFSIARTLTDQGLL